MADLAYTAVIQSKIARRLMLQDYSAADADQKAVIDGTWASGSLTDGAAEDAMAYLGDYAKWLYTPVSAGGVPPEWEAWFVARTVWLAGQIIRPERVDLYRKIEQEEAQRCISAYCSSTPQGTSVGGTTASIASMRTFVIGSAVRRTPPIFVDPADIDAATIKVIRDVWNRADWNFKRRAVTMTVTPYDISDASYNHALKTLTKNASLAANIPVGTRIQVTAGTGATTGYYFVASATANTVVLTESIGAGADGQTDIDFNLVSVVTDLPTGEVFQKSATRKWYYTDTAYVNSTIEWCEDGDAFTLASTSWAASGTSTGLPRYFRYSRTGSTQYNWLFAPSPDAAYTLKGEAFIRYPGDPSNSTSTTVFDYFPSELHPIIKDLVYAEVMMRYDLQTGNTYKKRATEELERTVPNMVDQGRADADTGVRDFYHDRDYQGFGACGFFGGGL